MNTYELGWWFLQIATVYHWCESFFLLILLCLWAGWCAHLQAPTGLVGGMELQRRMDCLEHQTEKQWFGYAIKHHPLHQPPLWWNQTVIVRRLQPWLCNCNHFFTWVHRHHHLVWLCLGSHHSALISLLFHLHFSVSISWERIFQDEREWTIGDYMVWIIIIIIRFITHAKILKNLVIN